jgi:NADH dehydrogenase
VNNGNIWRLINLRKIVVVGGGYAGFYAAWGLEHRLRPAEAEITVIDPRPYMTYQPFLPEVAAGSIEARHAAVSLRRHLRRTKVIAGTVTRIDHALRQVVVRPAEGVDFTLHYDIVVVTAGVVTRKFPVPGIDQVAIGLKHVEEAVAVRDRILVSFDRAANLPPGPERTRLLTVLFVGGGFTGVEGFGETLSLATSLLGSYPELALSDLHFHLVEARDRILPEVTAGPGAWVVRSLEERGARVHLNTSVLSAENGHVVLSDGQEFDAELIVWTAGNAANPVVAKHTDLPVTDRGLIVVRADLQVGTPAGPVGDAWSAGDAASIPDVTAHDPAARTVPNAQHAYRQGRQLARNIAAVLRGHEPKNYAHASLGTVATLGLGRGIFESGPVMLKGFAAWLIHRGYHVLAVPSWERKVRVLVGWIPPVLFGRDIVSLQSVQTPRDAFVRAGTLDVDR